MPEALKAKIDIFNDVEPILDLLRETHQKLDALPRSTVAARQLHLIISKLAGWKTAYEPLRAQDKPDMPHIGLAEDRQDSKSVPTLHEIDLALKAYRRAGYFGLNPREKFCIEYFDQNYHAKQA